MSVTIGNQSCTNVQVTDNVTYGALQCIAPPGPGYGDVQLRVAMLGSGIGAYRFEYNPPVVQRVTGSPCDADSPCPLQVR